MEKKKKEPQQQSQDVFKEVTPIKTKTQINDPAQFITPKHQTGIPDTWTGRVFKVLD
jgi:hypothetical protein